MTTMRQRIRDARQLKKEGWFELYNQPLVPKMKISHGKMYLMVQTGECYDESGVYYDQTIKICIDLDPDIVECMRTMHIPMAAYQLHSGKSDYSYEPEDVVSNFKFVNKLVANCSGKRIYQIPKQNKVTSIENIQIVRYDGVQARLVIYGDITRPERNSEILLTALVDLSFGDRDKKILKKINKKIQKEIEGR